MNTLFLGGFLLGFALFQLNHFHFIFLLPSFMSAVVYKPAYIREAAQI